MRSTMAKAQQLQPHATISCQELVSLHKCVHSGWLRKRSRLHRTLEFNSKLVPWRQRYAAICDGCMYMYETETSREPCAAFSLCGFNRAEPADDIAPDDATWIFKLSHRDPSYQPFYFSVSSLPELRTWSTLINMQIKEANTVAARNGNVVSNVPDDGAYLKIFPRQHDIPDQEMDEYVKIGTDRSRFPFTSPAGRENASPVQPITTHRSDRASLTSRHKPFLSRSCSLDKLAPCLQPPFSPSGPSLLPSPAAGSLNGYLPPTPSPPAAKDTQQTQFPADVRLSPWMNQKYYDMVGSKPDMSYWRDVLWHDRDKEKAGLAIYNIARDGAYLVRINDDGIPVLVYFSKGETKKMMILTNDHGAFYLSEGEQFATIRALLEFYSKHPVQSQNASVCLTIPYKRATRSTR